MLLRNTEHFTDLLELTPGSTQTRRFPASNGEVAVTPGFFFEYSSEIYGLGVSNGAIWLIIKGELVQYQTGLTTSITNNKNSRSFQLFKKGESILAITYRPAQPQWNFFSEEQEDVGSFLLIHNILSNNERKTILLSHKSA